MISKWVNDFRIADPYALRPKQKGRESALKSSNKPKLEQSGASDVDTSSEHVKKLEDEVHRLKIENAYLKELMRLRLEEEAHLKKQRESSKASEENSV